ncbi:thermonuclease family protein, partial [candidate division FCPU426 bacterium]|nr:thermonuclease family protein [candidate division FCPU426 bacterium]
VVRVLDGKALLVALQGREITVQLQGVRTPAEANPLREKEYHQRAIRFLERFALDQEVLLSLKEPSAEQKGGREAYVYRAADHQLINYAIIRMGFGHAQVQEAYRYKRLFIQGENEAREEGVGLWGMVLPKERRMLPAALPPESYPASTVVYLTIEDKKYHRDYCRQLQRSRYPMALGKARAAGYKPCALCFPPPRKKSPHPEKKR